jgi:hypothetical protein
MVLSCAVLEARPAVLLPLSQAAVNQAAARALWEHPHLAVQVKRFLKGGFRPCVMRIQGNASSMEAVSP